MVNIVRLNSELKKRGMNWASLATEIGVSRRTMCSRLQQDGETFKISEMIDICNVLQLTPKQSIEIFLKRKSGV